MTNTTYNVRKLTSEFAKDQQQPQLPTSSQPSSSSLFTQAPQYHQQQQATAVSEIMYNEPISYVSPVVFDVHPQEPEPFHFGAAAAATATATESSAALFFNQPQSRPAVSLPMSAFAAAAATALIPVSSSMTSPCVPHHSVGHWTHVQETQTQAQDNMTRFFPVSASPSSTSSSPAVHQIHTPHPSIVAQQQRHSQHYHYSSSPQQNYFHHHHRKQQANDWIAYEDPTLSPLSQDLGLGGSLADLSDLDNNSPLLSHDLDEFLFKTMSDNLVFESNNHFDLVTSLISSTTIQQQQQQNVPAPPSPTPAAVMVPTPQLPPFSPISSAAAAFVASATPSVHFHVSSPTLSSLSPPLVPYSPSAPFLIPSNLFQQTAQPTPCPESSSSSTPVVARSSSSKSTLKTKSRKRTQAIPSSSSRATASTQVISSIPYFDSNHDKRFRCAWTGCDQDFERHHNCKAHYSTHTGERHFKCEHPGCQSNSFRQKGDLTRHMRIHTNERPYACGGAGVGCEMAFGRCDQKAKHEKKCPFLAFGR